MIFSYNWLKELSETKRTPEEIGKDLTLHSFEVEKIEKLGSGLEYVIIGEVLIVQKHANADKLNVAKVNIGKEELQIVCGAPNLKEGQKVPVAIVGAVLPGNFLIKEAEIRGVKSCGMICAEDELGIGENHEGIIVLPGDAPVGEKFTKFMALDDSLLEIDVLPNRAHDALSYEGMAREIAMLEKRRVLGEEMELADKFEVNNKLEINIQTDKCLRYIGAKVTGIKIGESPLWLKNRLRLSGINPINNIVDITNYIMLQTGQPLHAFDAKGIETIGVRLARQGEKLIILNKEEIELRKGDMVITSEDEPIALAGVMGGLQSGINDLTEEIILEAAAFDAVNIRKTKTYHSIQSDAAYRYERNIDPNFTQGAMIKALELIIQLTGATVEAISDKYPKQITAWEIALEPKKVQKLLGIEIDQAEIINILNNLGIETETSGEVLNCQIHTRRIDINNQEDLIEEIGRVFGYTKIATVPLKEKVQVPQKNEERELECRLKEIMASNGFDEIKGYSFYSREDAQALGLDDEKHITLLNPMNPDQELIRRTLISGLLRAGKKSLSYYDKVNLFDVGRVYAPSENSLPQENLILSAVVIEKGTKGEQFFLLKGAVESLLAQIKIFDTVFVGEFDFDAEDLINFHPARKALIKNSQGLVLGVMGELTKGAHKYFGLKKVRGCVVELNVAALLSEISRENFYVPLAKFPSINRDISMVVDKKMSTAKVTEVIVYFAGNLLQEVSLFDTFINPETDERSMAFHLTFADPERTLTAQEIDEKIAIISDKLEEELKVVIKK